MNGADIVLRAIGIIVGVLASGPALAHHVMGGQTPATFLQGLLSGLGHPIIGLDHLAAVIGIGLISSMAGRPALLPLPFVIATLAGCLVHVRGIDLPLAELVIGISIVLAAVAVSFRLAAPAGVLAAAFAVFGTFHGYAYGESIVGAETTPLTAYLLGFAAIQYAIAFASGLVMESLRAKGAEPMLLRFAGIGMALVAIVSLANTIIPG